MTGKDKNISLIIFLVIFVVCFNSWLHREKEHTPPDYSLSSSVISTSDSYYLGAVSITPPVIPGLQFLFKSQHSGAFSIPGGLSGREFSIESLFSCRLALYFHTFHSIQPLQCISFHKKIPPGNRSEDVIPLA